MKRPKPPTAELAVKIPALTSLRADLVKLAGKINSLIERVEALKVQIDRVDGLAHKLAGELLHSEDKAHAE